MIQPLTQSLWHVDGTEFRQAGHGESESMTCIQLRNTDLHVLIPQGYRSDDFHQQDVQMVLALLNTGTLS